MMEEFQDSIGMAVSGNKIQSNSVVNYGSNFNDFIIFIVGGKGWRLVVRALGCSAIDFVGIAINFSCTQNTFNVISMYVKTGSYLEFL